jgi:5-methyltetrahydropteroyltriglutamate--homocysteine methyltransferase
MAVAETPAGTTTTYRADHVGSLLRPKELLEARTEFANGRISEQQLHAVEDQAVLKALALQEEVGIDIFTEGEYRRTAWSAALRDVVDGLVQNTQSPTQRLLGQWQGPNGELATSGMSMLPPMVANQRLQLRRRMTGLESAFLREHAPGPWKITMPGPYSLAGGLYQPGVSDQAYGDRAALLEDVIQILQQEIDALIEEGVAYIQLDSLHYVERVADHTIRARMIQEGEDPDQYLDLLIAADNRVLEHARGRGVTVGLHMCRGNNRSAWHAEGSYEPVAEKAFQQLNVDRFLLEYDTDRAGGFEPLRFMPRDKTVVLGLISSKESRLEPLDTLRRRIDEAAQFVPLERLAISPQCGFASTMLGNLLSWDEQRRKLELVVETARTVWGN